jgi:hypothetical protein
MTVNESDGVIEVQVNLDKAPASDITYQYELGGTAYDTIKGFNEEIPIRYWDYFIDGKAGEVKILAGQTSATISIQLFTDFTLEGTETIEMTLKEAPGQKLSTNPKITINVEQEDGKIIFLDWEAANTDMDLILHIKQTNGEYFAIAGELWKDTEPEALIIPNGLGDISFATSYVYYSGGEADLNFTVSFIDLVDGVGEDEATTDVFAAKYTAANKNKYDTSGIEWAIVQTFDTVDGVVSNISAISVPSSASRIRTRPIPGDFKKALKRLHPQIKGL